MMTACRAPSPESKTASAARSFDDFVRRLTAVAVSIGLTTALMKMEWFSNATVPVSFVSQEFLFPIGLLLLGLWTVVLSWQGFTSSASYRLIEYRWLAITRLFIDVIIVFLYLLLISTSRSYEFFMFFIALIFLAYVAWDIVTIFGAPKSYYCSKQENPKSGWALICAIASAHSDSSSRGGNKPNRPHIGPKITLCWAVGVWLLAFSELYVPREEKILESKIFGAIILFIYLSLYRVDKTWGAPKFDDVKDDGKVLGFSSLTRGCFILLFFIYPLLLLFR